MTKAVAAGTALAEQAPTTALRLTVEVPGDPGAVRVGEPVTVGVPLPAGACRDEAQLALAGTSGPVAVQARPLERWPDGSIRWALLDFQANAPAVYEVSFSSSPALPVDALTLRDEDGAAEIVSAGLVFRAYGQGEFRLDVRDHCIPVSVRRLSILVTLADGRVVRPEVTALEWESRGALRSVLKASAAVTDGGRAALQLAVRMHFHARLGTIRFDVTVANHARAEHPGGFWELGDSGSVMIRDCSVHVETGATSALQCSMESDAALERHALPFELYQDSSGGANWQANTHVNRDGVVPMSFCGYRVNAGGEKQEGLRATPLVWMEGASTQTGLATQYLWQNAPKAIEADGQQLVLRLFPGQFGDLHEIQAGEQKTHAFHVAFAADDVALPGLDWARRPARALASPAWYCAAGAAPYLVPAANDPSAEYVALVQSAIEGADSFEQRREVVDEYGWRNFGDIYADHETVFHKGPTPLVSHYNNQYDAIAGFAYHFFRSGDARWMTACDELAWHVRDIDIYHTSADKSAYSGGLFWHTAHYVDAGKSSHRSYPKADGVPGGGPANEHVYSTGLMLHYLMTGEVASRDAAVGLAEWALRIDDGMLTPFRWVSRGDTGLASKTHTMEFHGPGRGAGNVIVTLLNAHRLTARAEFLQKAEALIRRCIHPKDDIASLGLRDPESRWSYTVFLQALGRYLDEKVLRGEFDERYDYARESLRHYAAWMLEHESLYLEKPEILEYPTETWAAQDMRKCDVFQFAARYGTAGQRDAYLRRAEYFFAGSMRMLLERPTRFTARPRVLLMICGFMRAAFETGADGGLAPDRAAATVASDPIVFVPQKAAVKQRLKRFGLAGLLGGAAALTALVIALF